MRAPMPLALVKDLADVGLVAQDRVQFAAGEARSAGEDAKFPSVIPAAAPISALLAGNVLMSRPPESATASSHLVGLRTVSQNSRFRRLLFPFAFIRSTDSLRL